MDDRKSAESILDCLKNRHLNAITFVMDYVQFQFDGPYLNAYVWPTVRNSGNTFDLRTPGYRDACCNLIGNLVVEVSEDASERLLIRFADGATVEVSLKESDREGPEAAMLQDPSGKCWNVW